MSDPSRLRRDRLAELVLLLAIGAMASFPFWIPHHRNPIPTFYQDWWALALGCVAVLSGAWRCRTRTFVIPPIAWPVLALALLVLAQWAAGLALPALAAFGAGTLLWAAALTTLAANGRSIAALAPALAWGLFVGALVGALIGLAQWFGAPRIDGLLSIGSDSRIWGNLNQPNHLAIQLLLGTLALLWLHQRRRLPTALALPALGLLVFVGVGTASRSYWAAFAASLLVAHWLARRDPDATDAVGIRCGLLAALAIALVCKAGFLLAPDTGAPGQRGLVSTGSDNIRLGLLVTGARIALEHPLAGAGWGRFAKASFPVAGETPLRTGAEHAHNLVAQLAAETGLAGLVLLGALLALSFRTLRGRTISGDACLALLVLAPIAAYSLLEYPLWYAFFLGPAALALGLLPAPTAPARSALAARLVVLLAVAGLVALAALRHDYGRIERTLRWPLTDPGETPMRWADVIPRMARLRRDTAFAPWIDYALARAVPANGDDPAAALRMIDLAMTSFPSDDLAIKRVLLLAIAGDQVSSIAQFRLLEAAFPANAEDYRRLIASAGRDYPALAELSNSIALPAATDRR
jgi:O-antigen ligase